MIKRVGIVAKPRLTAVSRDLPALAAWLEARGVEPVFDEATADLAEQGGLRRVTRDDLPRHVDLILLLGGDGTLLGMADRAAQAGIEVPILGVNFGGLGFLTEVTYGELYASLEAALAGTAPVESRLMLRAVIERHGEPRAEHFVLNDVTVTGGSLSRVVEFAVSVGGEFVARFHADGIIISTPTGSTAYSLAAGGPVVHPKVPGLILTPICPFTLTNRPLIVPDEVEITIRLDKDSSDIILTLDGQKGLQITEKDVITVCKSVHPMLLILLPDRHYFDVLKAKLRWSGGRV